MLVLLTHKLLLRTFGDEYDEPKAERQDNQRHESKHPANCEHHDDNTDDHHHGGNNLRQALVQCLANGINIVRDTTKHLTVRSFVKIAQWQSVNFFGDTAPQTVCHFLGHVRHDPALSVTKERAE